MKLSGLVTYLLVFNSLQAGIPGMNTLIWHCGGSSSDSDCQWQQQLTFTGAFFEGGRDDAKTLTGSQDRYNHFPLTYGKIEATGVQSSSQAH